MTLLRDSFLSKKLAGEKLSSLTAYDYPMGRILDGLGLDFLLVGDSLGMVVLGHPDTTSVTLEDMLHHTAATARGVKKTPLIADLPIHTASTPKAAVANARALHSAGAIAVKVEGGREMLPAIEAILAADIPVLGHLGMLPQRVREEGGYRVKGKTPAESDALLHDAQALEEAGVLGIVLELVTPPAAVQISQAIACPSIGIGSGEGCDGQILVSHDLLGLFPWFTPGFVKPKAHLAKEIESAVTAFISETKNSGSSCDSESHSEKKPQ